MIDVNKLEFPVWLWRYFSTGNVIEIVHVVGQSNSKNNYKEVDKTLSLHLSSSELKVDNSEFKIEADLNHYYHMEKFEFQEQTIKSIFTNLSFLQ
jgi:hypothetical protein